MTSCYVDNRLAHANGNHHLHRHIYLHSIAYHEYQVNKKAPLTQGLYARQQCVYEGRVYLLDALYTALFCS